LQCKAKVAPIEENRNFARPHLGTSAYEVGLSSLAVRELNDDMPSTSIRKIDYDPTTRTLSVWLVASGKRYDYDDVPPEIYAAFRQAFSKGRFFNDAIRNQFSYREMQGRDYRTEKGRAERLF
jgi:KTSC domain